MPDCFPFFQQGHPAKSASSVVEVSIVDVNDNKPLFESSFYDVQLAEDVKPGHCFLTVGDIILFYWSRTHRALLKGSFNARGQN